MTLMNAQFSTQRHQSRSRILYAFLFLCVATATPGWADDGHNSHGITPNVVIQWNQAALQGVRNSKLGPPIVARALAIVHTCIYDAWAAYDEHALGTRLGSSLRQPGSERQLTNKNEAISFAAYRALIDLFPADEAAV